jgi:hypothetical protein
LANFVKGKKKKGQQQQTSKKEEVFGVWPKIELP